MILWIVSTFSSILLHLCYFLNEYFNCLSSKDYKHLSVWTPMILMQIRWFESVAGDFCRLFHFQIFFRQLFIPKINNLQFVRITSSNQNRSFIYCFLFIWKESVLSNLFMSYERAANEFETFHYAIESRIVFTKNFPSDQLTISLKWCSFYFNSK